MPPAHKVSSIFELPCHPEHTIKASSGFLFIKSIKELIFKNEPRIETFDPLVLIIALVPLLVAMLTFLPSNSFLSIFVGEFP